MVKLIEKCQRVATWDKPFVAVFSAPFRGYEYVPFRQPPPVGMTADRVARVIVRLARERYARQWTLPPDDAKTIKLLCIVDTRHGGPIWQ